MIALPKLAVLAVYKLPRFLDCFSLVGTFDALDARKVSISAILVHELRSASCNAQAGARTRKAALTRLPRDGDHKRLRALETQLRALFSIQSSASWRVSEPIDVLNSAAYPLDEYPPTVSDPRRDGLQCNDLTKFMKSHCIAILRMASLKIPHRSKRGGAAPAAPPGAEIRAALARPDRPPAR